MNQFEAALTRQWQRFGLLVGVRHDASSVVAGR